MRRVIVTGATGFVGTFVCRALSAKGARVEALVRRPRAVEGTLASHLLGPQSSLNALSAALDGAEAVVHLAAAVHDVSGRTSDAQFQLVNRDYPLLLARAALAARVRRFVFVSTIKVNGEGTARGVAYSEASAVAPRGAYAESKWQAEQGLVELCAASGLALAIVRPPLVYGPGVRANFHSLMRWVQRGVPLPFAALNNARSLIYVENLADLLVRLAIGSPALGGARTYLTCDGEDLSTPDLVRRIALALGVAPRLFPVPELVLSRGLSLLGRTALADRLLSSLRVDSSLVRRELSWAPPFSVDEGLARTAAWFKGQR